MKLTCKVLESSDGISIVSRPRIYSSIVSAHTPPATGRGGGACAWADAWFSRDHQWRSPFTFSAFAYAQFAEFLKLGFCDCQLVGRKFPGSRLYRPTVRRDVVADAMLRLFYAEGWFRQVGVFVEQSVERVLFLTDEIDPRFGRLRVKIDLHAFKVL